MPSGNLFVKQKTDELKSTLSNKLHSIQFPRMIAYEATIIPDQSKASPSILFDLSPIVLPFDIHEQEQYLMSLESNVDHSLL